MVVLRMLSARVLMVENPLNSARLLAKWGTRPQRMSMPRGSTTIGPAFRFELFFPTGKGFSDINCQPYESSGAVMPRERCDLLLASILVFAILIARRAFLAAKDPKASSVQRIDESSLMTRKGNRHPLATLANDRGEVRPDLPMQRMLLVLQTTAEAALVFALTGCRRSPSFNVLGSYFPGWIACMVASILVTALVRLVLNRLQWERQVPVLPLFYSAVALLIACLIWLIAFE
jgi:hypothetical protein